MFERLASCIGPARRSHQRRFCSNGHVPLLSLLLLGCFGCVHVDRSSLPLSHDSHGEDQRRIPSVALSPSLSRSTNWLQLVATESEGAPFVTLMSPQASRWLVVGDSRSNSQSSSPSTQQLERSSTECISSYSDGDAIELTMARALRRAPSDAADDVDDSISLWDEIVADHHHFYSRRSLGFLGLAFAGGAVVANTGMDKNLYDFFQTNIRDANSDEWSEGLHLNKEVGNGFYTLPLFGIAAVAGRIYEDIEPIQEVGEWGERSLRTFLVGAPPLIATQLMTGGSRPFELSPTEHNSHWHPFHDENGVSGHSFMGAIPFLSAAKMTDNPWLRGGCYFASVLPGMSRINDGAHYPSQVMLGWVLAFLAAEAVDDTFDADSECSSDWRVVPLPVSHVQGIGLERRW